MRALTHRPKEDSPYVRRPWLVVANESAIIEAFDHRGGGSSTVVFKQLEHQLLALFDALPLSDARELHRRLSNPAPDDPVAARFARMIVERRNRLIDFLAGAPRRAAIAGRKP